MGEPLSITLGAIALIQPLFKACHDVCEVYRGVQNYGSEYRAAFRKLNAQRALLKEFENLDLAALVNVPSAGSEMLQAMKDELEAMRVDFETCHRLLNGFNSHQQDSVRRTLRQKGMQFLKTSLPNVLRPCARGFSGLPNRNSPSLSSNDPTESTTSTIAQPSVNMSSLTNETPAMENAQTKGIEDRAPLHKRFRWEFHEKEKFTKALANLDESNRRLGTLIQLKTLSNPLALIYDHTNDQTTVTEFEHEHNVMQELHEAISSINHGPTQSALRISIQIRERPETTREKFYGFEEVEKNLRPNSYVFMLQAQDTNVNASSHFLLAETPCSWLRSESRNLDGDTIPEMSNLQEAVRTITVSDDKKTFKLLGYIPSSSTPEDRPHIYKDISTSWTSSETLATLLQNFEYSDQSHAISRIELAVIIARSYYQFSCFNRHPDSYPRTANFQYYHPEGGTERTFHEAIPFLSCGFGAQSARRSTHNFDLRDPPGNAASLELGLILYQIGSWEPLKYENGARSMDLETLAMMARNSLFSVIRCSGIKYADIVRGCLNTRSRGRDQETNPLSHYIIIVLQNLVLELRG